MIWKRLATGSRISNSSATGSHIDPPNERGIPFFFLRVDEAGYISKRLSAGD